TLTAANYNFTTYVNGMLTIVPALTASLTPVAGPTNVSVAIVDVTFSVPINTSSFTSAALTLTDNGSGNLINSGVTIALVPGTTSTYAIGGLSSLTTGQGLYTLTVNTALIQDQNGFAGTGTSSTSWLMDTTPPTSQVNSLPQRETSLSFAVTVTGSDLSGQSAGPAAGIATFDIYAATNGGAWALWTTVPASSPSAIFTGQSDTTYSFYSIAHDKAGNTETRKPLIEASTYLPDLTPPVTSVNGTKGTNPSTVNASTGTFTLNLTGTDSGGSGLAYFEVYVSIDSGPYTLVNGAAIPAGLTDSSGNVHAPILYQGLTDGASHTYAFYSIGIDNAGNTQSAPANPNLTLNEKFTSATPSQLQVTSLVVENGAVERSYIRYLDIALNESDSQSGGELTEIVQSVGTATPDITLYKYDLNGTTASKTAVSLSGVSVSVIDHAIELDFGAKGIGGNPNTTAVDGYYEVDITVPNGQTAVHHFYRLLGDVTGDGMVDQNDLNNIAASIGESAQTGFTPLNADVTGAGSVTSIDLTLATRSKGRKLGTGLFLG
ncbi:MAG TPA: dockerin type I domain-containing protein, partial [Chloroflexota bacterium]|nr:dockerin type I domain-containing protein [Chloroflexota bacterium]